MLETRFFRYGFSVLLVLCIIWVSVKVNFIFFPIVLFFRSLFVPLLISGILFYLFRPIVQLLEKWRFPRSIAILTVYLLCVILFGSIILLVAPIISKQFTDLIDRFPSIVNAVVNKTNELQGQEWFNRFLESFDLNPDKLSNEISTYLVSGVKLLGGNLKGLLGFLTNLLFLALIIPFIVFYLLQDSAKITNGVLRLLPETQRDNGRQILSEMDQAISKYIRGKILVATCVGIIMFVAYWAIGLDYAFLLALVVMITDVIPYFGSFLAAIPAVLVAWYHSPFMVAKVIIVLFIAEQIKGNLISPLLIGKQMKIHPLTIILLMLVTGGLFGLLGMLLTVPTYAVLKIAATNLYRLFLLRKQSKIQELYEEESG